MKIIVALFDVSKINMLFKFTNVCYILMYSLLTNAFQVFNNILSHFNSQFIPK